MADEELEEAEIEVNEKKLSPKNKKMVIGAIVVVIIVIIAAVLISRNDGFGNGNGDGGNHAPSANAGKDRTVNIGETVRFDASNSSDVDDDDLTYNWDFDGDIRKGVTVTYTFEVAGVINVTLTVDDGKLKDIHIIKVTVNTVVVLEKPTITLTQIGINEPITGNKYYQVTVQSANPAELIANFTFAIIDNDNGAVRFSNEVSEVLNAQGNVTFIDTPPFLNRLDLADTFTVTPDETTLDVKDGDKFVLYYKLEGEEEQVAEVEFEITSPLKG